MANVDAPKGLVPHQHLSGGQVGRPRPYDVDVANATAIFKGDLVSMEADGNITPSTANDGIIVVGVAAGAKYTDSNGNIIHADFLPATTAGTVSVYDDPNTMFLIQSDSGTNVAEADIGNTANHAVTAGSAVTGLSGHELDASDIGTGAQLKIVDRVKRADNAFGDEHVDLLVLINEHFYKAAVAGV